MFVTSREEYKTCLSFHVFFFLVVVKVSALVLWISKYSNLSIGITSALKMWYRCIPSWKGFCLKC